MATAASTRRLLPLAFNPTSRLRLCLRSTRTCPQVHANDLTYSSTASGPNHFIDLLNFEASYPDLVAAFGTNQAAMQSWYDTHEPIEHRVETFNGLDYVASYGDLMNAFGAAGSMKAVQD